ncbi:hypothetical protein, partial, partial [Absidia glauca]
MKNAIVETFEARCIRYLEHCLRQEKDLVLENNHIKKLALNLYDRLSGATTPYWPTSVVKSNDLETILNRIVQNEDLGPSPITAKSLTSNICDYTGVLYRILKKYEALNVSSASISSEPTIDDLAENVSPWWAYGQLKDLDDFTSLGKRQRQK